jgi:phosphatidylglycerophosphate synthase
MQSQVSPIAGAAAPILVVLPWVAGDSADPQVCADTPILGLTLGQRTTLAARRAGFAQVFFLGQDRPVEPGAATIRDWSALAATLGSKPAMIVIVPAAILSEIAWLKHVIAMPEPVTWALLPNRIAVLGGDATPDALATLNADGAAYDISTVAQGLTRSIGLPAVLAHDLDPILVATPDAIPVAERRLLRGLVKDSDGFVVRHVDRRISLQITRRLASTDVRPSQVTILSVVIGLAGALFFLSAHWAWQTVGALLFLLHSIVDGCDGELARLKFQESRAGGLLDFWGDNIVHVAVFGCISVSWAWSSAAAWPLWIGAAAIFGTAACAVFVYWKQLRDKESGGPLFTSVSGNPDHGLGRALDAMSSREFIYATPIVAFFGQTHWIVVLAAIGTPTFFLVLVVLAMRETYRANAVSSLTR